MSDVTLKNIGQLLDKKLDEKLDQKFDQKLNPIKKDITFIKEELKEIKYEVKEIRGALNSTIKNQEHLTKRVDRLDDHLNLEHLPQPTA